MADALAPSALILLEQADAQRLAVVWQHLGKDRSNAAWMALAGLPRHRSLPHMEILRRAGICRPDGTVAPLALQYVAAQATRGLKPRAPERPPDRARETGETKTAGGETPGPRGETREGGDA